MDGLFPTFTRRKSIPPTFRELTWGKSSSRIGVPERVIVPLQDRPDSPYEVMTQVGEQVKLGQKIGFMGKPPVCIYVHTSISGKVDQIGAMPHPLGFQALSVSITSDGKEDQCDFVPLNSRGFIDNKKVFEGFQEMGIPLNYHLLCAQGFKVSNLLINATEFEPYITSRHQMIKERGQNLVKGLQVLMKACSAKQAVIFIEKRWSSLVKMLQHSLKEAPEITIRGVGRPYPETAKGFLAKRLFYKKFIWSKVATPKDIMAVDLFSLLAIYNAWFSGAPFTEQLITIAGSGIRDPQNIWVKIGTPLVDIIRHSGNSVSCLGRVTLGGPLMGITQHSLEVPLTKKIKGLFAVVAFLFDEHRKSRFYKRVPCIKCAKCVDICPAFIVPNMIADFIDNKHLNDAEQWGVFHCVECGLCEYVCPSRIPLLELMKLGKILLKGEDSLLTRGNLETLSC